MSCGEARSIEELAQAGGCHYDNAIKHLAVLRAAGLVVQGGGRLYLVAPQHLPSPGQPLVRLHPEGVAF